MHVLYEDTMPHAGAYFSQLGTATPYSWQHITPEDLRDIDILAVRSTTVVDKSLLKYAKKLKYVATATAGTNHLALDDIRAIGAKCYAAGGCNAVAVAQYVVSGLMYAHQHHGLNLAESTVGIVGAGNVGTALSKMLDALSIGYVLCDPPLAATDPRQFVSLDQALACDVVTLHVPFTSTGAHPTENLLNKTRLRGFSQKQWLINASRGEVIDESALLKLKQEKSGPKLIVDVWQNEPAINTDLIAHVELATPHIAGHTHEGKIRGTQMVFDWLRSELDRQDIASISIEKFLPKMPPIACTGLTSMAETGELLRQVYDIHTDHRIFVQNMAQSASLSTSAFSKLRKQYRGRREHTAYTLVSTASLSSCDKRVLANLGFNL